MFARIINCFISCYNIVSALYDNCITAIEYVNCSMPFPTQVVRNTVAAEVCAHN
jgi:hypothetical protein